MVNAKELRIGNLLQCQYQVDGPFHTITVTGVQQGCISWEAPGCCPCPMVVLNESYRQIPLTPEILEKTNFEEIGRKDTFAAPNMDLWIEYRPGKGFWLITDEFIAIPKAPLQYLHQLQNLFYSLCGEELEVKL